MKLKGINPIEQHLEKIVLGVVALVFLAVLATQFLLNPNLIEVGQNQKVPPAEVYDVLAERANQLKAQVEETTPPLPEIERADLLDAYVEGFERPVAAAPLLPAPLGAPNPVAGVGGEDFAGALAVGSQVAPLVVPALGEPLAFAQWISADPYAVASRPSLAAIARPGGEPYDVAGVSVQGTLNGERLREVLTSAPEGQRPIPRKLWQGTQLAILGLELERQRLADDGQWGPAEPVETFAAEPSPLAGLSPEPDADIYATTVRDAAQSLEAIAQPAYIPQISGDPWLNPAESVARVERLANTSAADRLRAQIARVEQDIQDLRSGRTRTTTRRTTRPSSSSGGGDPRMGPSTGGSSRTTSRPSTTTRSNSGNERQIEAKERQLERYREQLAELGFDEDQPDARSSAASSRSRASRDVPRLLEEEALPVWAHDLTAEPGATYRYRLRAVLNNPLYRREASLDPDDPEQLALAADPLARGVWSDWTEPVLVPARTYLFVTSASESDQIGGGARVSGELYTMYYGYYRLAAVSLEPGDAARGAADLPDTLALFDPTSAPVDVADRTLADIAAWQNASAETRSEFPALPAGVTPAPEAVAAVLDLALVDLSPMPISESARPGGRPALEAVFRGPGGSLVVRTAGEAQGPLHARVSSSADRGELAVLERINEETPARARQTGPDPRDYDPRIPAGDPRMVDPRMIDAPP